MVVVARTRKGRGGRTSPGVRDLHRRALGHSCAVAICYDIMDVCLLRAPGGPLASGAWCRGRRIGKVVAVVSGHVAVAGWERLRLDPHVPSVGRTVTPPGLRRRGDMSGLPGTTEVTNTATVILVYRKSVAKSD